MEVYIRDVVPFTAEDEKNICLYVFFSGCDFNCGFCNTADLIKKSTIEHCKDIRDVKKIFDNNRGIVNSILFTGGEPCLQKAALLELAQYCKQLGFQVGIHTNGSKPTVVKNLIEQKLLDFAIVDLKYPLSEEYDKVIRAGNFFFPIKTILEEIQKTLTILQEAFENKMIKLEIKTTIVPGLIYKKEQVIAIAAIVEKIGCPWILQRFHNDTKLLEKKYHAILSPSMLFMFELRDAVLKEYPQLKIEVHE